MISIRTVANLVQCIYTQARPSHSGKIQRRTFNLRQKQSGLNFLEFTGVKSTKKHTAFNYMYHKLLTNWGCAVSYTDLRVYELLFTISEFQSFMYTRDRAASFFITIKLLIFSTSSVMLLSGLKIQYH